MFRATGEASAAPAGSLAEPVRGAIRDALPKGSAFIVPIRSAKRALKAKHALKKL